MKQGARERFAVLVSNYRLQQVNYSLKTIVSHFTELGFTCSTIYRIMKKYSKHETAAFLLKFGRKPRIDDQQLR